MVNEQIKTDEEENNVVLFQKPVATKPSFKDPDDPTWLNNLDTGTIFLVRRRANQANPNQNEQFALGLFQIIGKTEKGAVYLEGQPQVEVTVDPIRFCRVWELYEVLRTPEQLELETRLRQQDKEKQEQLELTTDE